mgnify:FL=1
MRMPFSRGHQREEIGLPAGKLRLLTSSATQERASVLIIVLWVAFGLVSLAIYFANSSSLELRAADNRVAALEAEQAIAGAARYVSNALANVTEPGTPPDPATFKAEAVRIGNARYWLIGQPLDEEDDDVVTWGLVDEASKLNLNTATAAVLAKLPRMTDALAAAVVEIGRGHV